MCSPIYFFPSPRILILLAMTWGSVFWEWGSRENSWCSTFVNCFECRAYPGPHSVRWTAGRWWTVRSFFEKFQSKLSRIVHTERKMFLYILLTFHNSSSRPATASARKLALWNYLAETERKDKVYRRTKVGGSESWRRGWIRLRTYSWSFVIVQTHVNWVNFPILPHRT